MVLLMYQEATATFFCKKVQNARISSPPEMIRFIQSRCRFRLGFNLRLADFCKSEVGGLPVEIFWCLFKRPETAPKNGNSNLKNGNHLKSALSRCFVSFFGWVGGLNLFFGSVERLNFKNLQIFFDVFSECLWSLVDLGYIPALIVIYQ